MGPIKAITHIYAPDMDADLALCVLVGYGAVQIFPSDISAAPGVQFDVPTINVTVTDFNDGGFTEIGARNGPELWLNFTDTGCHLATTGDLAMTVTGTLDNGDTFSINILVP
ncbi:MAG: hypothetical protein GY925_05220 [Actinomycetia bacterium]|nr:hypothetical protein [Actinomycetes bacterium]